MEKTASHQDLPLPLPQHTFIECNVCGRKCVSKTGMHIHVARMHHDKTVGDGESVETEKASVSEAREYGADVEINVEVMECGDSDVVERGANVKSDVEFVECEKVGVSDVRDCRGGVESETVCVESEEMAEDCDIESVSGDNKGCGAYVAYECAADIECETNLTAVKSGWRKVETKAYCSTCSKNIYSCTEYTHNKAAEANYPC